jgi:predicted membrane chloride channel (bestrophin family)
MPSLRVSRASDEFVRVILVRIGRRLLLGLGFAIVVLGVICEVVPPPIHFIGMPLMVIGLMIVLRNSFKARRRFIEMQRSHPKFVFPLRRLLRREPEVVLVFWQAYVRSERLILPKRFRFAVRVRRHFKLKRRARVAAP